MRIGIVKVTHQYVVDLDNAEMVLQAKDALYEDIKGYVQNEELFDFIGEQEDDGFDYTQDDIDDFLLNDSDEDD